MNDELLLSTLQDIAKRLQGLEKSMKDTQKVCAQTAADVSTVRSRLIEEADRTGGQVRKNAGEIIQLDARLTKVERAARIRAASNGSA